MRSSPASLSQRRRLSSDQTLPRPGLLLQHLVRLGDHLHAARANRARLADLPLDHDVHRVGAGQLLVDAARWRPAPARGRAPGRPGGSAARAAGRPSPEHRNETSADQRGQQRPVHHPVDDPADQLAEPVHQPVGRRAVRASLASLRMRSRPISGSTRITATNEMHDRQRAGHAEGADQPRLREQQRGERQQRRAVRQHAGRPDHAHGEAHRLRPWCRPRAGGCGWPTPSACCRQSPSP